LSPCMGRYSPSWSLQRRHSSLSVVHMCSYYARPSPS
jgi:hypothetical protein